MTGPWSGGLVDLLVHRKTAIILLLCLLLLALVGAAVPQQGVVPADYLAAWQAAHPYLTPILNWLGFFAIRESFVFLAVTVWLLFSVSLCNARRIRCFRRPTPPDLNVARPLDAFPVATEIDPVRLTPFLRRYGYRFVDPCQGLARAGLDGRPGSYLFHASFIILVFGCLLTVWGKSQTTIILTEGQSWQGGIPPPRLAVITRERETEPLTLRLKKFSPAGPSPERSILIAQRNSGPEKEIAIGPFHAARLFGYTFYLQDHGFSPRVTLKRREKIIFQGFIALKSEGHGGRPEYRDVAVIGSPPLFLFLDLVPDYNHATASSGTLSRHPKAPYVGVSLRHLETDFPRRVITIGNEARFGDFQLRFDGLRYWSEIRIVRDPGAKTVFAAFLLGIFGLVLRVTCRLRWLWISFDTEVAAKRVLKISYLCRHDPHLERYRLRRMAWEMRKAFSVDK